MRKWLYSGGMALALCGLVAWRFSTRTADAVGQKPGGGGKTTTVEVALAGPRTIVQTVQSIGNLESPIKVEVSPKIAGRIDFLQAREGDVVHTGQLLLKINPSDLEGAVVQQQANIAQARSRLSQAKLTTGATDVGISSQIDLQKSALAGAEADYEQVQKNFDSQVAAAEAQVSGATESVNGALSSLSKEKATLQNVQSHYDRIFGLYSKGFTAAQDLDDARTAVEVQKGSVAVAQSQVASAQSVLKAQEQNLQIVKRKGQSDIAASRARLAAAKASLEAANANRSQSPAYRENISALESQVDAAVAQYRQAESKLGDTSITSPIEGTVTARKADPGGLANPGTPVLEVQYLDSLYVTTTLPIDVGSVVHEGQQALITVDALPGKTFTGPIVNLNPAADPTNRQFGAKVKLDNRNHLLRPGMYSRVSIVTGKVNAKVVVPREAIVLAEQDGAATVAVINDQNVAEVRPVVLGATDDKGSEVLSGVKPGERVVVLTYTPIRNKQKVTITDSSKKGGKSGGH